MTSTTKATNGNPLQRTRLYLAGIGVTHSIAYGMHDHIARSLSLPFTFTNLECPTVNDMMLAFRAPDFAGGVVTMPYKKTVMPHLDGLDDLAVKLGACNNVYLDQEGKLRGTNTDWRGIKGCLLGASEAGRGKAAMILGAGGASRAAVYALSAELDCNTIYVVNRDEQEVLDLLHDAQAYQSAGEAAPNLIHVTSAAQARALQDTPFYIVGTVPDFEPKTAQELESHAILHEFLSRNADTECGEGQRENGVLLDMCFKPRRTRILKMGEKFKWCTVEGTGIIGHQIGEQWRLWAGEEAGKRVPKQEAWAVLQKAAEENPAINF